MARVDVKQITAAKEKYLAAEKELRQSGKSSDEIKQLMENVVRPKVRELIESARQRDVVALNQLQDSRRKESDRCRMAVESLLLEPQKLRLRQLIMQLHMKGDHRFAANGLTLVGIDPEQLQGFKEFRRDNIQSRVMRLKEQIRLDLGRGYLESIIGARVVDEILGDRHILVPPPPSGTQVRLQ